MLPTAPIKTHTQRCPPPTYTKTHTHGLELRGGAAAEAATALELGAAASGGRRAAPLGGSPPTSSPRSRLPASPTTRRRWARAPHVCRTAPRSDG